MQFNRSLGYNSRSASLMCAPQVTTWCKDGKLSLSKRSRPEDFLEGLALTRSSVERGPRILSCKYQSIGTLPPRLRTGIQPLDNTFRLPQIVRSVTGNGVRVQQHLYN